MNKSLPLSAALAGVPTGLQAHGLWAGRRQLFIKFAGAAETATMYPVDGLVRELKRAQERSKFHSIAAVGRDTLGNAEFLRAALAKLESPLPVAVDTDGQRPDAIPPLSTYVTLMQICVEVPVSSQGGMEQVMESLALCAKLPVAHSLVVMGRDEASDADYVQIVEQAHRASPSVPIVVHPGPTNERNPLDGRWGVLLEQMGELHPDVRVAVRLTGVATVR